MYDELVKRLRELQAITEHCDEQSCDECENRELCDKHDNKTLSGTYKEAADAIEELSRDLDSMNEANIALYGALPKWIPVTERLPEKYEVVIALNKRGKQHDIDKAYWNGFGFYRHYRKAPYSNVTHWMPLPEPPKEEKIS